jgi:hypothetical protein
VAKAPDSGPRQPPSRTRVTPREDSGGCIRRQLDVIARVPWDSVGKEESKMKINCLGCGYKVDLADGYDDYVGQIKCFACGAIMEIATQKGSVRAVRSLTEVPLPSVDEALERSLG